MISVLVLLYNEREDEKAELSVLNQVSTKMEKLDLGPQQTKNCTKSKILPI